MDPVLCVRVGHALSDETRFAVWMVLTIVSIRRNRHIEVSVSREVAPGYGIS
jgi:hypothetical protein